MSGTSTVKKATPPPAPKTGSANPLVAITANLRESGIYIAFVVVVALFWLITDNHLSLSPGNITNIILQYSYRCNHFFHNNYFGISIMDVSFRRYQL